MLLAVATLMSLAAIPGLVRKETRMAMGWIAGVSGSLYGLGALRLLTATPDDAACAHQSCLLGPPNPEAILGILLCALAVVLFFSGCVVLLPRLAGTYLADDQEEDQDERDREDHEVALLLRHDRSRRASPPPAVHTDREPPPA